MNKNANITNEDMVVARRRRPSKKQQIIELWKGGQHDINNIAYDMGTQPSYVASVLQGEGLITGYHDLYTTPPAPENVYSEEFRGRLGYKDKNAAIQSIDLIDTAYEVLGGMRDRAGQHHCLVTALTMFNRARYIGKKEEADVFRQWLMQRLNEIPESGDSH